MGYKNEKEKTWGGGQIELPELGACDLRAPDLLDPLSLE